MKLSIAELQRIETMFATGVLASEPSVLSATDQMMDAMNRAADMEMDARMAAHNADQDRAAMDRMNAEADRAAADRDAGDRDAGDRGGGGRDNMVLEGMVGLGVIDVGGGLCEPPSVSDLIRYRRISLNRRVASGKK